MTVCLTHHTYHIHTTRALLALNLINISEYRTCSDLNFCKDSAAITDFRRFVERRTCTLIDLLSILNSR